MLPYKTLQAAINKANTNIENGIGTKVVVNPGVYRESISIRSASPKNAAPLTIEASSIGSAVISGSEVLTGWTLDSTSPFIYSHGWTSNSGSCDVPGGWPTNFAPIARRTEMLFVNGVPYNEVASHAELRQGTFFVDEDNDSIYMSVPPGTVMHTALIEAAVRPQILNIQGRSNVVLRGLVLSHAATCMNQSGASISDSTNVLVDSVQAIWNNWGGLGIFDSTNVTVQNSIASHNGGVGFQGVADTNALFSYNESDFNNWRGAMGALYDWGMGGIKLMQMRSTTVRDHYSYRNQAQGLWFDTDNENIAIDNATLSGNVMAGLQLERNEGPIALTNSRICSSGVGVNVLTSENVTIADNTLYNNSGTNTNQAEIFIGGTPGGQEITDWQNKDQYRLFTTGLVLEGNTIEDAAGGQNVFGTYLSGSDWSKFADSLSAANNHWYDPVTSVAFKLPSNKMTSLGGWQSATGTDYSSHWQHIAPASCTPPSEADFSVNLNNRTYSMTGGKATVTAQVNSFEGKSVYLSVNGLPAGVTASLNRNNVTGGNVSLVLTASSSAVHQNVPITLYASGTNLVHSVTFYVQVS